MASQASQNLSTHILDTSKGQPAPNVDIHLYQQLNGTTWTKVTSGITDADGRFKNFFSGQNGLRAQTYKLKFDVKSYFDIQGQDTLYPYIEVIFNVKNPNQHYHIPLLLNPFGYSTYRGS